jgi:putative copper export protein/mono/diheme cytochrome c family protein
MITIATIMAMVRGLHLAATLSLLGTVGFIAWMLPAASVVPDRLRHRLTRLWWVGGLIALLAGAAWLTIQSVTIADTDTLSDALDALRVVGLHTRYGNTMLARLGLVLVATILALPAGRGVAAARYLTLVFTAVALGLQGLIGHAGATAGAIGDGLVLSESLHLLAAGIWLGALLPLWLSLRALAPAQAVSVCERFTPIGLACVLVLAGSGFAQGLALIGSLPALFGTEYGHFAVLKITLFVVALALAALNRLWLTDRLAAGGTGARRHLQVSVCLETCLGLAIVTTAAFLASSMPAMHETPIWPFSWRPSLDVLSDPYGRRHLLSILLPSAIAGALVMFGLFWRPALWLSLIVFVATLALASPKLASLLTIAAYPTTFAISPTEFADSSIGHGAALFAANCAVCHGAEARGDGPAAKSLPVRPADLTAPHFWAHTEGDLFWFISHGITAPSGAVTMPAFGNALSSDARWALVDFLRAHNAGLSVRTTGRWTTPTPLPQFDAICGDGSTINLDDLRGRVLRIIASAENLQPPPSAPDDLALTTIFLSLDRKAKPVGTACVTIEPAAWNAFSILLGVAPGALAETQVLADQNGWLRARWRPGDLANWNDPQVLAEVIRDIVAHPLVVAAGNGHPHQH